MSQKQAELLEKSSKSSCDESCVHCGEHGKAEVAYVDDDNEIVVEYVCDECNHVAIEGRLLTYNSDKD